MPKRLLILGGGVGGLSAAIYSRLEGFDVCLVEQASVGGKAASIEQQGFRLDPGPSIIILIRLYRDFFEAAGRNIDDYIRFTRLDPISKVFFEDQSPIQLPSDRAACEALVEAIDSKDGAAFRQLMEKLDSVNSLIDRSIFEHPYDKPWQLLDPKLIAFAMKFDQRLNYKQYVDKLFRSPLLRSFFYGFPSYGGQSYHSKAPGALLIPYLMVNEGVWYPEGGVAAIPNALHKLAVELGVEFVHGKVEGFQIDGDKVTAVQIEGMDEQKGEVFISNIDRYTSESMLGRVHEEPPSFSYFTIHWGLKKPLPIVSHHTLLVPKTFDDGFRELYDRDGFPQEPIVYLNETAKSDPSSAIEGGSNLFAVVTSPAENGTIDWAHETSEFIRRTKTVMKKFDIDVDRLEPVFERVQTPSYFRQAHGNYKGSLYGPDEPHRLFKMLPLSNSDDRFNNLFYAGGSVQPGAGLPMVTLSGKFAARAAAKKFKASF